MTPTLARLERVLVMVPWLLANPGADITEVAVRFDTTAAELAGDLDVLGYCGLPGYGGGDLIETSLVGDRVTVRMADYFRRPLALSLREAVTLVLAGRALAQVPGLPDSRALQSAVAKLEASLAGDGRRVAPAASAAGARLAIDLRAPGDEHLPVLRRAVAEQEVVHLVYRSASKAETSEREVEPVALVGAGGAWYLQAWCRLARAPRAFRLDRIRALTPTGEHLDGAEHQPAGADARQPAGADARQPAGADARQPAGADAIQAAEATFATAAVSPPAYEPGPGDLAVTLDLAPDAAWVLDAVRATAVSDRRNGVRRVLVDTANLAWLARLVLRAGGGVRVVGPPALADQVAALAAATRAAYAATGQGAGDQSGKEYPPNGA